MNAERERNLTDVAEAASRESAKLEALMRLAAGVAHDLNNILQVIKSSGELMRRRLPQADAETSRLLDMVTRNAERGTTLGRQLLGFSGRQLLQPAAVNANRLIADMADPLREVVGRAGTLETVLGGGLWQALADPRELEAAIVSLVTNAREALAGGGKVTVETANATIDPTQGAALGIVPGEYVTIAVQDTGSGMSEEVAASAFDPYFTTKEGCRGLGLSRVQGFARQSGGYIRVGSAPGSGTTVTLYLRRHAGAEVAAMPARPAETNVLALGPKPPPEARALEGLRVLVVEDESLIGMMVEDLLEQLGCRMVGLISTLDKAIEVAKREPLDLALLDVDIGGQPVYPLAKVLDARGVPFVFMSGYGGLTTDWRGRPIIQKPFDLAQFRGEIERALGE